MVLLKLRVCQRVRRLDPSPPAQYQVATMETTGHKNERAYRGGLDREWARISTRNRKGPWWNSGSKQMNYALPKKYFDKLGLVSMLNELEKFQS